MWPTIASLRFDLEPFGFSVQLNGQAANLSLKGSPYWMAPEVLPLKHSLLSYVLHLSFNHAYIICYLAALAVSYADGYYH